MVLVVQGNGAAIMSFTENHVLAVCAQIPNLWHRPRVCGVAPPPLPPLLLLGTKNIGKHYTRSHVFVGLKRVDNSLVLGVLMEQISQRKQGIFA